MHCNVLSFSGIYVEIAEMDTNLTGRFRFNESDELVSIYFSEYIFLLNRIGLNYLLGF